MTTKHVFLCNDGSGDDFTTFLLAVASSTVKVLGVTICNACCYADQALVTLRAIERFVRFPEIPIGIDMDEMPNSLPKQWRKDAQKFGQSKLLAKYRTDQKTTASAVQVLADCLESAVQPVTIISTGPLQVEAKLLLQRPDLSSRIEKLVMMGGAIDARGNVKGPDTDGAQEWNVFANIPAFQTVLKTSVPIKLVTLDVTNHLPLRKDFIAKLALAASTSCVAEVSSLLWSQMIGVGLYLWDPTTIMSELRPDLFEFKQTDIDVVTEGRSRGRIIVKNAGDGRRVQIATSVNKEAVLIELLALLSTSR